ncbi:hypothetical protein BDR04DRAFT_1119989 [Suillus decipiens]|nr:hypothetical protein BDR04DRAFT_1119989 [Suillus decipiens]
MEGTLVGINALHAETADYKSAGSHADITKGSTHVVADDNDDKDDGVFIIKYTTDSDSECSIPGLLSTKSSNDNADEQLNLIISDDDWFSDVDGDNLPSSDDWEVESAAHSSRSDTGSFIDLGMSSKMSSTDIELAAHMGNAQRDGPIVKLHDLGTTCHISPYKDHFKTLSPISPKPFVAANKQHFSATAMG